MTTSLARIGHVRSAAVLSRLQQVGGDRYDLTIRTSGNRNVVTYDDPTAQIRDSDTGEAVVRVIDQSHVYLAVILTGGCAVAR